MMLDMAGNVTTGTQVIETSLGALGFDGLVALWTWFLQRTSNWGNIRWVKVTAWSFVAVFDIIALVALVVGVVLWGTGTVVRS